MKKIETKWLGGCTAEAFISGSVELIYDTKDKPKYNKVYYTKYFDTNNFVVVRIPNPSADLGSQIVMGVPKDVELLVKSMPEVIEHIK